MTVASTYVPTQYQGNGTTTAFSFPYQWTAAADVVVTLWDQTNQVQVSSVLNGGGTYDYTLTGTADATTGEYPYGTVTFNTAPLASYLVTLGRDVSPVQQVALTASGPLPAVQITVGLDRVMLVAQDAKAGLLATLQVPAEDPTPLKLPNAVARAGLMLGFDLNGNPVALTPQGGVYTPAPLGGFSRASMVASGTTTLLPAATGSIVFLTGGLDQAVTLPNPVNSLVGDSLTFTKLVASTSAIITSYAGAATVWDMDSNSALSSTVMYAGETLTLTWDGTYWRPSGITPWRQAWFINSLASPGYATDPVSTEQWGTGTLVAGAATITFPVEFETACLNVVASVTGISGPGTIAAIGIGAWNRTQVTVYGPTGSTASFSWRATGQ
jgi:hypothetical protein